ncbi:unnamed protein product [Brachionus calyciflorus]|uniref:Major facilitator superfamily (MFS) profile domain-containing protein n=1 Tax=Brachionus calyciflorus TaxID=104777 RepID=A0A814H354_9BILA|nr:unnamed protein product [Brachionus calyciflorus]
MESPHQQSDYSFQQKTVEKNSSQTTNQSKSSSESTSDSIDSQDESSDGNIDKHKNKRIKKQESIESSIDDDRSTLTKKSFFDKLNEDYDSQLENIGDRATDLISENSFFNCGLYQFFSFVFVSIAWTVGNGWYGYVSVFTGFTPEHECDYESMGNFTQFKNDTKCHAWDPNLNQSVKCSIWKYDSSQMFTTIITEYNFVCDKNYYFELAYSIEQIGYIVGTLLFSFVADIIGRKPVLISALISMSICGVGQYFIQNFIAFMSLGFLINSLSCGLEAVCVTLVLEMFSTSKRTIFGIGIEVVWVIVLALMAPLAYSIKLWRELRLVIFIVLGFLAVLSHFCVQESIRWLISMSRLEKTSEIIDKIALFNKSIKKNKNYIIEKEELYQMLSELDSYNRMVLHIGKNLNKEASSSNVLTLNSVTTDDSNNNIISRNVETFKKRNIDSIWDIITNKKFRLYVLIMSLNWFATALVYDGLTYLNNYIGENIYINWIAMNLIELPAQFFCYYVISRYGRRLTVSITLMLAGLTLLATFYETFDALKEQTWIKLFLFILAKFIITQSYSGVILHAPELFPTNLRSFGYGICLFSGKVTSVLSPMISIYLSKIKPDLPAIIYGTISIFCGLISLYVPETLNRSLPNSIDDVLKWPRSLTKDEWKVVKEMNKKEFSLTRVCKKSKQNDPELNKCENKKKIFESNTLPTLISVKTEGFCNSESNLRLKKKNSSSSSLSVDKSVNENNINSNQIIVI